MCSGMLHMCLKIPPIPGARLLGAETKGSEAARGVWGADRGLLVPLFPVTATCLEQAQHVLLQPLFLKLQHMQGRALACLRNTYKHIQQCTQCRCCACTRSMHVGQAASASSAGAPGAGASPQRSPSCRAGSQPSALHPDWAP